MDTYSFFNVFLLTFSRTTLRAPEVFRHEDYNETVDVYSYAMILFYLLDGKPPWPLMNGLEAVRRASEEGDRPVIPRNWDQRLSTLLMECWDDNPSARPPFRTILDSLNKYSSTLCAIDDCAQPIICEPHTLALQMTYFTWTSPNPPDR